MQPDSIVLALVRHAVGFAGAWLVSQGYLGEADMEGFIGAMLMLAAIVWSVWNKFKTGEKIQGALDAPKGTSRERLDAAESPVAGVNSP